MRLFVDTNVFLDLFLNRGDQGEIADRFFHTTRRNRDEIYASAMSFRDVEYIVSKYIHSREQGRKILFTFYSLIRKIVDVSADDVINSLFNDGKDYEDNLIIESAERSMVDAIVTNNVRDFTKSSTPILSPEEYLTYRK